MRELLSNVLYATTLLFAVASMLSVGLGYSLSEIIEPLRHRHRILRAVGANFVLVPLLAFAIVRLLSLDPAPAAGLILLGFAAGAPFLIKLTIAAEGHVGLSTTLLVLLLPMTVIYMPLLLPVALPGVAVYAMAIATPLVLSMLLPLAAGLAVKGWSTRLAARLQPFTSTVASVALLMLLTLTVLLNFREIVSISGSRTLPAAVVLIVGAFLIGYALGTDTVGRTTLGLGTAQRNVAAAMVVATQSFDDSNTATVVVVASVVDILILFPIALILRRRAARTVTMTRRAA
jgi:BASS family bile acid:Na+ symporter